MSNETSTVPMPSSSSGAPEYKSVHRLLDIPLIKAFTTAIDANLTAYMTTPYGTAKGITTSVIGYTQPVQVKLSPIIDRADDLANSGLDVCQTQIPSLFTTKPEDITNYIRGKREDTSHYVRQRSASVGKSIDQLSTPVVDVFETVVKRFNAEGKTSTPAENQYQYQRAISLSVDLSDSVRHLSAEQWKQLQNQSALVQAATEKVQAFASSSRDMSNEMLAELDHLRKSTATFASEFPQRTSTQLHRVYDEFAHMYSDFNSYLTSVIADVKDVAKQDTPVAEKATKLAGLVQEKAKPLLDTMAKSLPHWRSEKPNGVNGDTH